MNDEQSIEAAQAAGAAIGTGVMVVYLAVLVFMVICMWRLFSKAGKPGWASIIPIYNAVVMCQIAGKPGWWVLLMFIPLVNIIISILVIIGLAQNFGRGVGTIIGLILLPIVFIPILAFGSAQYQGRPA